GGGQKYELDTFTGEGASVAFTKHGIAASRSARHHRDGARRGRTHNAEQQPEGEHQSGDDAQYGDRYKGARLVSEPLYGTHRLMLRSAGVAQRRRWGLSLCALRRRTRCYSWWP